jgi:precorrin-6Y C5,15-methyltransferase (decarboxylating)
MNKIHVIGIGYRPLEQRSREIISLSDMIVSNEGLMEVFMFYEDYEQARDKITVVNNLQETMNMIRQNYKKKYVSVLASGDPMFFGIGRPLIKEFGRDSLAVYPDLSSMQVAFSRIKEPWGEAFLLSLHGGPHPQKRRKLEYEITDIPELLEKHRIIGILTDRINNPSEIAGVLISFSLRRHPEPSGTWRSPSLTLYVCERLGYPDEKITEGSPGDIADLSFSYPNVVIIRKNDRND